MSLRLKDDAALQDFLVKNGHVTAASTRQPVEKPLTFMQPTRTPKMSWTMTIILLLFVLGYIIFALSSLLWASAVVSILRDATQ